MIEVVRFIVGGLFLALIQTLIFKEVNIAWWIKPMPYVYLFLILPLSSNRFGVLIGAFFFGLTIDAFGGSLGMHTAACVTTVFVKIILICISWMKIPCNCKAWGICKSTTRAGNGMAFTLLRYYSLIIWFISSLITLVGHRYLRYFLYRSAVPSRLCCLFKYSVCF